MRGFFITLSVFIVFVGLLVVPANAKVTEIRYWTFLDPASDDVRSVAQTRQIKRFEELNPDIRVKVEIVHWSKQVDMYIQAAAAGKGPDVALVNTLRVPQVVAARAIEPLNEFAKEFTEAEKQDFIIPWKDQFVDGKLWCLNLELRGTAVFYRKDLFEQAGVSVPTSWDQVVAAARKLNKERVRGFIWPTSHKDAAGGWQFAIGLYFNKGEAIVDSKGRATIGNDTGIKLYQLLVDMVKKYNVMPSTPISIEEGRTAFKAGVAAMYVDGTQVFGSVRAAQPHTGTFPLPSLMAAEPAAEFPTGQAFTIGINSKNKDAAWKFIKFMVKPEAQLINAKVADQLPAIKSVLQDPWFNTNQGSHLLQWGNNLAKNSRGLKIPEHYIFLMDCMAKAYEQVLVGGKPIPEALEEAAKQFNKRAGLE